jgi:hypothetical protein
MRVLRAASIALPLAILASAAGHAAVTVPFLEDFTANERNWENSVNAPLDFVPDGGPDDGSHVMDLFSYLGFVSPFGGGPVIFRATGDDNPSGNAFEGDWVAAGVGEVRFWVHQNTGQDLTYFVRFATSFNFPGVVFDDEETVPSGVWTQVVIPIDADDPACQLEGVKTCAEGLENVGNFQIGTDAPDPLPTTDQEFALHLDKVEILAAPEPGQTMLALVGAAVMAAARRRRRA